jgi:hypothetical protein
MKSICIKNIPEDLYHDLNRIKELDSHTITSMFIQGARMRVKELGTQIAENRKRRNSLNDMVGF